MEPLVLLPGMNCSRRLWVAVADELSRNGVDVRHEPLDGEDLDDLVDSLVARLPRRFALAGLSLGGIVAMALARRFPERVTRLCLASTNPHAPSARQRVGWDGQLRRLASGATARDLQADLLPTLLRPETDEHLVEQVLVMADEVGAHLLAQQLRLQTTRVDERPGLRHLRVPTLVLAAENDRLCPVVRHEEIHSLVAGSHLVILPESGHLSPIESPARVAAELTDWLAVPERVSG